MTRKAILQPGQSYTFYDYFTLKFDPADVLQALGCSLKREYLQLPTDTGVIERLDALKTQLADLLPLTNLTSEQARREVLIAPILQTVTRQTQAQLSIEYSIEVSERLKGSLNYLLVSGTGVVVVEAKQADLTRGFTQLGAELIAYWEWSQPNANAVNTEAANPVEADPGNLTPPVLYGAVTTGEVWQFGIYYPTLHRLVQDIALYRVPADMETVLRLLLGILQAGKNNCRDRLQTG